MLTPSAVSPAAVFALVALSASAMVTALVASYVPSKSREVYSKSYKLKSSTALVDALVFALVVDASLALLVLLALVAETPAHPPSEAASVKLSVVAARQRSMFRGCFMIDFSLCIALRREQFAQSEPIDATLKAARKKRFAQAIHLQRFARFLNRHQCNFQIAVITPQFIKQFFHTCFGTHAHHIR